MYTVEEFFYMHIDFTARVAREYLNTEKNIPARYLNPWYNNAYNSKLLHYDYIQGSLQLHGGGFRKHSPP